MADGASRLFNVMRLANGTPSNDFAILTVTRLSPLTLSDGDRLSLTSEFLLFSNEIDTSKLSIGDKFSASIVNGGQIYQIDKVMSSRYELKRYVNTENALEERIRALESRMSAIEGSTSGIGDMSTTIADHERRIKALEDGGNT